MILIKLEGREMKIVKVGSRKIKVYFSDKKVVEKLKKFKKGKYAHGTSDKEKDEICIRHSLPLELRRICFWHELNHLLYDFLDILGIESSAEISARYIDEVLSRNVWVREMYK